MSSYRNEWAWPRWILPLRVVGRCLPLFLRRAVRLGYRWWFTRGRNVNTPAYWDEVYATEAAPRPGGERDYTSLHRAILQIVPVGSRVLDTGCGTGILALKLLHKGCKVMGLDFSERAVEICRSQGIDARVCELPVIPTDVGVFDVAVCSEVLEHLDRPEQMLTAMCRVVRVGGLIVISVPADRTIDTYLAHVHFFGQKKDVLALMNRAVAEPKCIAVAIYGGPIDWTSKLYDSRSNRVSWLAWGRVASRA